MMRCLAILVLLLLAPLPAAAQDAEASPPPMDVVLRSVDAVLAAGDDDGVVSAVLELEAGPVPRDDLRLVTTVFTRVDGRDALRVAMDGDLPGVFSAESSSIPSMAAGTTRLLTASSDRAGLSLQAADRTGVYPLQYQVFAGAEPVASVLTSLIVLPEAAPDPLPTSTVVRVHSATAAPLQRSTVAQEPGTAGVATDGLEAILTADGPLRTFAADIDDIVGAGSAAGITLVASGRLLRDLEVMAEGVARSDGSRVEPGDRIARRAGAVLAQLRRLAVRADTEVLAYPHGPADLVALVRSGQADEARRLLAVGHSRTAELLGTAVQDAIVVPPDGLDTSTLAALGPTQPDAVLLDARYLAFARDEALEPVRRLRTADGGEVRLLVPDAALSQLLGDPAGVGTPTVVQQVLAETAAQWLAEEPGGQQSSGVLLTVDVVEGLGADLTSELTAAIRTAPWLRPVGVSALADQVTPSDRVVRLAYPPRSAASELDADYMRRLGQAREALDPLRALLPADDPTPDRFAESLLVAAAIPYRSRENHAAGSARIDEVLARLAALTDAIQVLPSAPITLTATTGEVPVTLTNTGDVPVLVSVALSSTRFSFPRGASQELTLPPHSVRQLGFDAQALNPGGFAAITVTVQDPTAGLTLTQTRISVRSTAFPVVGLIAIVGSAVVLLVWAVRQSRRRRRRPGRHERIGVDQQGVA